MLSHRASTFAYLLDIEPPEAGQLYQLKSTSINWCPKTNLRDLYKRQNIILPVPPSPPEDAAVRFLSSENAVLSFYGDRIMPYLVNTPLFRGWFYDVVIILEISWAAFCLWRSKTSRAEGTELVVLALGCGVWLHQAGLFFFSGAALFRYLLPTVLTCVVMTLFIVYKYERKWAAFG